ncbi:hypothetical protein ABZ780_29095 [Micromonospora sp. NPDC047467]|uniref:hypothetical protein n=1 Tax=Micromonospora sp. NPDC047467 TaxID=3154814 RepID=UPI0033C3EC4D
MFPFNFYGAHKAVGSLRWGAALEKALQASLGNVPALPGRTLVVIDQSPSMFPGHGYFDEAGARVHYQRRSGRAVRFGGRAAR